MAIKPIAYWVKYYTGTTQEQLKIKAFAQFLVNVEKHMKKMEAQVRMAESGRLRADSAGYSVGQVVNG